MNSDIDTFFDCDRTRVTLSATGLTCGACGRCIVPENVRVSDSNGVSITCKQCEVMLLRIEINGNDN